MKKLMILLSVVWLAACSTISVPEGVTPVSHFEAERYLGKWYEIARLDNRFERGLEYITAEYSLRDDQSIKVINRGLVSKTQQWKESEGKAYFVQDRHTGFLKVSFFGPFYGSYIVFELDEAYQHALVSGPDKSYLWILSRQPELAPETLQALVNKAKRLGFATDQLIYVQHD